MEIKQELTHQKFIEMLEMTYFNNSNYNIDFDNENLIISSKYFFSAYLEDLFSLCKLFELSYVIIIDNPKLMKIIISF